jgi:hypothetical protein
MLDDEGRRYLVLNFSARKLILEVNDALAKSIVLVELVAQLIEFGLQHSINCTHTIVKVLSLLLCSSHGLHVLKTRLFVTEFLHSLATSLFKQRQNIEMTTGNRIEHATTAKSSKTYNSLSLGLGLLALIFDSHLFKHDAWMVPMRCLGGVINEICFTINLSFLPTVRQLVTNQVSGILQIIMLVKMIRSHIGIFNVNQIYVPVKRAVVQQGEDKNESRQGLY